ncbi:Ty1/Copia family ribonuclease HI, partial [Weizmannia coagulans]|nr:Ty1/Copia family ribonuclease HI [Heyndrickxia coagulans]
MRYLHGTSDMGLFYSKISKPELLGYTDAGYLSNSHKAQSQIGYVFTCGGTTVSWRSIKQTMVATSSNHLELLAIHVATKECVWLRSIIQHVRESCGFSPISRTATIVYEDNAHYIAQLRGGYINGDRTKHISPKSFHT